MQFATLAVLLASYALKTRREFWLIAAAIVAALAFGTKYPGGLVLLPVGMAAWFMSDGCSLRETTVRLARISAVFVATFVITTPAILVHPRQVLKAVLYETQHYATGHGGHTVPRGFQHGWRMLEYFGTVLFSSNVAVALFIFVLAIVGISSLMIHNWRAAAVLLAFPIAYVLYFSTQQAMVVRNLLAVAPFLAIAAAVGAGAIKSFLRQRAQTTAAFPGEKFVEVLWVGLLAAVLCWNALWLVGSANSIIARHSDQFIREAAQYVRIHSSTKFLLSPRVKRDIAIVQPGLDNITADLNQADAFVLYAREGMHRWHDWPANRPNLTQACFGPREINFNMYPGWWGDDRILVISRRRAEQIGLHIAGISADTPPPAALLSPATAQPKTRVALTSADSLASSWALPSIDPRSLVAKAEAESIAGEMLHGPASGGWELDGTASTYLGSNDLVVSISVISTSAFNLESDAPESVNSWSDRRCGLFHSGWSVWRCSALRTQPDKCGDRPPFRRFERTTRNIGSGEAICRGSSQES